MTTPRVGKRSARSTSGSHGRRKSESFLAGAYADPPDGAALVFRADDGSVVRDFVAHDPYVREGLVKKWVVRQWTVVIGSQ